MKPDERTTYKPEELTDASGDTFGKIILRRLGELDKTQSWLARRIGVCHSTMFRYVSEDRIPNASAFMRICRALSIDPFTVVFKEE